MLFKVDVAGKMKFKKRKGRNLDKRISQIEEGSTSLILEVEVEARSLTSIMLSVSHFISLVTLQVSSEARRQFKNLGKLQGLPGSMRKKNIR